MVVNNHDNCRRQSLQGRCSPAEQPVLARQTAHSTCQDGPFGRLTAPVAQGTVAQRVAPNVKIDGNPILPTAFGIFVGAVLALLLMYKGKTDDTSIAIHVGNAFQNALTSIGNTAAMSAVGTVAQATVGFTVMIDGLTGMGGNPLISAAICAAICCFVTGGATGGTSMIGPTLASTYSAMGVDIAMLGRIVMATGHVPGTLPNGGFINTAITGIAHDTYKNCFKYSFFMCTVANLIAVIAGIIVMSVMGYAA